jgi:2-iminobutanoate/2-iminopropanoate deaminase
MRKEFRIPELGEPISHYTHAVQFGEVVFVSGIVARGERGELIGGDDAAAQTRQIFRNMERVLKAIGAGSADVLKVTVFLTDMNDRVKINPVRQEYFGAARPASTLVEISRLALTGARVEIEFVVGLPGK